MIAQHNQDEKNRSEGDKNFFMLVGCLELNSDFATLPAVACGCANLSSVDVFLGNRHAAAEAEGARRDF